MVQVKGMNTGKRVRVVFYRTEGCNEPVRDWLKELGKPDSLWVGEAIKLVEYGWPVGMPTCRPMGDGLFEVRVNLPGNRTARILFCLAGGLMGLLHGFIKKTRATPKEDLDLALKRKKDIEG